MDKTKAAIHRLVRHEARLRWLMMLAVAAVFTLLILPRLAPGRHD